MPKNIQTRAIRKQPRDYAWLVIELSLAAVVLAAAYIVVANPV